jgi:chromatin structure-remodeling complex subunit RSC1/2
MPFLKPDEKIVGEGDKLPEPIEPGSEEGPPTVGAIYRGDSPEPEKEPTPPPPPPQPVTHDSRNLESMASMTPGLPQPMPYKNPMTPGLHGYPPHSYRPMAPQQQLRYPSVSGRQHQQTPQNPPHISEQPLAFTMPVAVPSEVAELVAKDNQGRVLWFGVPPVDVVGWSGGEGIRGHSLEYLAKKRKKEGNVESMQDVQRTETSEERGFKKRATEILVKALEKIGK